MIEVLHNKWQKNDDWNISGKIFGGKVLKIYLIRHGKVDYKWRNWYSSKEFDKACLEYNNAKIIGDSLKNNTSIPFEQLYVSELRRTHETARKMFMTAEYQTKALLNEVPLRSAFESSLKWPLFLWNFLGRLQWWLNINRQPEIKQTTQNRASEIIKELIDKNQDCVVITHGFYMHTLAKELKVQGYIVDNHHIAFSNLEMIVATAK